MTPKILNEIESCQNLIIRNHFP